MSVKRSNEQALVPANNKKTKSEIVAYAAKNRRVRFKKKCFK